MAGPNRVFLRRAPSRFPYGGWRWAFVWRAPAGLLYSVPKSGFYTAGPSRIFILRAPAESSVSGPRPDPLSAGPDRAPHLTGTEQALADLSNGEPLPGPQSRAPVRPSKGGPHRALSRLAPAGLSYSGPQSPGPQSVRSDRTFIRRATVGPLVSVPRPGFHTASSGLFFMAGSG